MPAPAPAPAPAHTVHQGPVLYMPLNSIGMAPAGGPAHTYVAVQQQGNPGSANIHRARKARFARLTALFLVLWMVSVAAYGFYDYSVGKSNKSQGSDGWSE
ncbi:hypothetical protein LTR10_009049 [Elasticomyces elasticus]|nr:hypothetical protein LTR10_009049 [Elasticomyces elasticus]KAK4964727.1 hypothetical protein LTR42_012671 [Elasticomyces elasticus]